MKSGGKPVTCFQNGIGAGSSPAARCLKTAWIDDQAAILTVDDRSVGMTIDNAIHFRKKIPEGAFNIKAKAGPVGQANGMAGQFKGGGRW